MRPHFIRHSILAALLFSCVLAPSTATAQPVSGRVLTDGHALVIAETGDAYGIGIHPPRLPAHQLGKWPADGSSPQTFAVPLTDQQSLWATSSGLVLIGTKFFVD